MTEKCSVPYEPTFFFAPGETLAEILDERGLDNEDLAMGLSLTASQAQSLLEGTLPLTPEIAAALELMFGASAQFWLNSELNYRRSLANEVQPDQEAAVS